MNPHIRPFVYGLFLVLAAGCSRPGGEPAAASGGSGVTAVDRAVVVARAIRAAPSAADSILAAHGMTHAGFDLLLYEIAADSSLARSYSEALR